MSDVRPLEVWRPVPGFEALYQVSDQGRVKSLPRLVAYKGRTDVRSRRSERILAVSVDSDGYAMVRLYPGDGTRGRKVMTHRLVLEVFVGPSPDGMVACHNDGVRLNNAAANLRWDTPANNSADMLRHGNHRNARKTHCPSGHPYSPENTAQYSGGRRCRTCDRAASARRSAVA